MPPAELYTKEVLVDEVIHPTQVRSSNRKQGGCFLSSSLLHDKSPRNNKDQPPSYALPLLRTISVTEQGCRARIQLSRLLSATRSPLPRRYAPASPAKQTMKKARIQSATHLVSGKVQFVDHPWSRP